MQSLTENFANEIIRVKQAKERKRQMMMQHAVRKAITKQESKLETNKARIVQCAEMARIRLSFGNKLGAKISMRQLRNAEEEEKTIRDRLNELAHLLRSVQDSKVDLDHVEGRINEICLSEKSSSEISLKESCSEGEFLDDLNNVAVERKSYHQD